MKLDLQKFMLEVKLYIKIRLYREFKDIGYVIFNILLKMIKNYLIINSNL